MAKITPAGNDDYNNEIDKLLKQIEGNYGTHKSANPVGSMLLSSIRASPNDLTILPMASYLGQGAKQCRAIEDPKDKLKSAPKGIGGKDRTDLRDKWYLGRQDDPNTEDTTSATSRSAPDKVAEGGGSDARAVFHALRVGWWRIGLFRSGNRRGRLTRFSFTSWSTPCAICRVLPTRCRRSTRAISTRKSSWPSSSPSVYISAKGGTKFRANHFDDSVLWSPLNTSKGFVEYKDNGDNGEILNYYSSMWQPFFGQLANLTQPKFNPFREVMLRKGKKRL